MPRQFRPRKDLNLDRMFETRSDAWEKVGLSFEVNQKEVKRAQRQAIFFLIAIIAVFVATNILLDKTHDNPGCTTAPNCRHVSLLTTWGVGDLETVVRIIAVLLVIGFGWGLARAVGRFVGPTFLRRMDPATAGTFGFMLRLATMAVAILLALGVAGVDFRALAVGGAFTAVIIGLAAQQTLGNVIAGMVLLSARPFRVGQRVRSPGGCVGGQVDGIVSSLGLLYTTLMRGADQIMIPNTRCSRQWWCRCGSPTRWTSRSVSPRASGRARSRRSSIRRSRRPPGVAPRCCSRRSTVTTWWSACRPRRRVPTTGAQLADEIMVALSSVTGEHEAAGTAQH